MLYCALALLESPRSFWSAQRMDDVILGADQNDRGLWGLERECPVKVDFEHAQWQWCPKCMPRYHCACLFKLGLREKQQEETLNRRSRQYFIWIGLLFIELPKLEVIGNYFIQIFSVREYVHYQMIASDSPQIRSFSFSYGRIAIQNPAGDRLRLRGPVLESPETFRVTILFVSSKKLCSVLRNFAVILIFIPFTTWKDQLYRISGSEFYEWLFGPVRFSGLLRNARQTLRFSVHSLVIAEKSLDFSRTRLIKDLRNLREKFGFTKRIDKGWALARSDSDSLCLCTDNFTWQVITANKRWWSFAANKHIVLVL